MSLSSLDILLDNPVLVETGDDTLSVYGVQMRHLPEFTALAAPLAPLLRERNTVALLAANADAALALAAHGCGRSVDWLREQDAGVLLAVLEAVVMCNAVLFAAPSDEPSPADTESNWADIFQRLISAGHRAADIPGYTFSQVHAYCQAIDRAAATDLRLAAQFQALAARYAGASDKSFKQFQESLSRGH